MHTSTCQKSQQPHTEHIPDMSMVSVVAEESGQGSEILVPNTHPNPCTGDHSLNMIKVIPPMMHSSTTALCASDLTHCASAQPSQVDDTFPTKPNAGPCGVNPPTPGMIATPGDKNAINPDPRPNDAFQSQERIMHSGPTISEHHDVPLCLLKGLLRNTATSDTTPTPEASDMSSMPFAPLVANPDKPLKAFSKPVEGTAFDHESFPGLPSASESAQVTSPTLEKNAYEQDNGNSASFSTSAVDIAQSLHAVDRHSQGQTVMNDAAQDEHSRPCHAGPGGLVPPTPGLMAIPGQGNAIPKEELPSILSHADQQSNLMPMQITCHANSTTCRGNLHAQVLRVAHAANGKTTDDDSLRPHSALGTVDTTSALPGFAKVPTMFPVAH